MNKRNLILVALVLTSLMVFTQIGAIAANPTPDWVGQCLIQPQSSGVCPACDGGPTPGSVCFAGGDDCNAPQYWECCDWAAWRCEGDVIDRTSCGQCC